MPSWFVHFVKNQNGIDFKRSPARSNICPKLTCKSLEIIQILSCLLAIACLAPKANLRICSTRKKSISRKSWGAFSVKVAGCRKPLFVESKKTWKNLSLEELLIPAMMFENNGPTPERVISRVQCSTKLAYDVRTPKLHRLWLVYEAKELIPFSGPRIPQCVRSLIGLRH